MSKSIFKYEVHLKSGQIITVLASRIQYAVPDEFNTLLCMYRGNTCVYVIPLEKVDHIVNPEFLVSQGGQLVRLVRT